MVWETAEHAARIDSPVWHAHARGMLRGLFAGLKTYWGVAALGIVAVLLLTAVGAFGSARTAVARSDDQEPPSLPAATGLAAEPSFPEPGSSCWAYFESIAVTGAADPAVILGFPTEKAVLLYQYSIAHNDSDGLARVATLAHRVDADAHLRIVQRTPSSIQATVLDGSSLGETLFIVTDECHARWTSSVVQEAK